MDKGDVVYIYTMESYTAIKKEWNLVICNSMDGSTGYYVKWNKSDKDKYYVISLIYRIEKTKQMNKHNTSETVKDTRNKQVIARGDGMAGQGGEIGERD